MYPPPYIIWNIVNILQVLTIFSGAATFVAATVVSVINNVNTSHEDRINDVQVDYCGTCLATYSSDRSVFDVHNRGKIFIADLRNHEGPWMSSDFGPPHVWQYPGILLLWLECHYLDAK